MLQFPPMPTWDSLHPLIIHFPIALLLLCPVFIAISAAIKPPNGRPYMIAALLVLLLGTASLFVAASTGEAASELAERGGAMSAVLESHEALASQTKVIFLGLSVILMGMFVTPRILRRDETRLFSTLLPLAFLALYSVGVLFLVNTAHDGGRLVHEFGVHAMLPTNGGQTTPPPAAESSAVRADKD
jgi:uncharacterized membrane protein